MSDVSWAVLLLAVLTNRSTAGPDLFAATTPSEIGNLVMVPNSESGHRATLPKLRRTIMTIRKTWCLILLVSASVVATSATLQASKQHQSKLQCDGGAPVPPFPTPPRLVADGGAPVPPFPTRTQVADGGAPVPPFPTSILVADGGAPVPPFPKLTLVADGGAPVPPFPTIRTEGMSAVQLLTAIAG